MHVTIRQFVRDFQEGMKQASLSESIRLGKGQCATIEEYKKHTGIIVGYERAATLSEQMLRALEEPDQDNDLPTMETD